MGQKQRLKIVIFSRPGTSMAALNLASKMAAKLSFQVFLEFTVFYTLGEINQMKKTTGCPKKDYTLFDFMWRKSYFTKIKSIPFTKD